MTRYFPVLAFVVLFAGVSIRWPMPSWVAGLYLAASLICFVMYAIDKRAATKRGWRVSERALLGLGLAGGWPGAIVAQQFLRHKTAKASFRIAFWASVVVNLGVFVALCTPMLSVLK